MSTIKVNTVRPVTTDGSLTLQGDSSGSGVSGITIDSSGNTTLAGNLVIPDSGTIGSVSDTDAITIDSSGNTTATLSSSSNIKAPLNASGSAPVYACRAWVNFNGIGTVAIRASGNVSSITDNGSGDYTINFTTAMPTTNYSVVGTSDNNDSSVFLNSLEIKGGGAATFTNSAIRINTTNVSKDYDRTYADRTYVCLAVFN